MMNLSRMKSDMEKRIETAEAALKQAQRLQTVMELAGEDTGTVGTQIAALQMRIDRWRDAIAQGMADL